MAQETSARKAARHFGVAEASVKAWLDPEAAKQRHAKRYAANREAIRTQQLSYQRSQTARAARHSRSKRERLLSIGAYVTGQTSGYAVGGNTGCFRADPCSYCGGTAGAVDHIVPRSAGGAHDFENRAAICGSCNSRKGTRSLLLFLLYRRDRRELETLIDEGMSELRFREYKGGATLRGR